MAHLNLSGIDDVMADMKRLGELTGATADRMLVAGAEEVKRAWVVTAEKHRHRATGDMITSIGYPKTIHNIGTGKSIDISPQGKGHSGVRNAEKAFLLHYGWKAGKPARGKTASRGRKGSYLGDHWVDEAEQLAGPATEKIMTEIWDEHLKGK